MCITHPARSTSADRCRALARTWSIGGSGRAFVCTAFAGQSFSLRSRSWPKFGVGRSTKHSPGRRSLRNETVYITETTFCENHENRVALDEVFYKVSEHSSILSLITIY